MNSVRARINKYLYFIISHFVDQNVNNLNPVHIITEVMK
jgi:hypothetical protein